MCWSHSWRVKWLRPVFTSQDLAERLFHASWGSNSSRCPFFQYQTSLTSSFDSGLVHFLRPYPRSSLFHMASSRCLICSQVFVFKEGFPLNTLAGMLVKARSIRKWFGVSGSSSSLSLPTCVKGRALTKHSISVTMVVKTSQVNLAEPRFKRIACFTICTSLAQPGAPQCRCRLGSWGFVLPSF